jgi:hypothetical protein
VAIASPINLYDAGQIVGAGSINGEVHAVLLSPIRQPASVPEPASALGILAFGAFGAGSMLKRKQKKQLNSAS